MPISPQPQPLHELHPHPAGYVPPAEDADGNEDPAPPQVVVPESPVPSKLE